MSSTGHSMSGADETDGNAGFSGYVHSVETAGTVDGPGIRFVVFLSGCPLQCAYCHNPDCMKMKRGGTLRDGAELLEEIVSYKPFMERTGGGVTIDRGEVVRGGQGPRLCDDCRDSAGIRTGGFEIHQGGKAGCEGGRRGRQRRADPHCLAACGERAGRARGRHGRCRGDRSFIRTMRDDIRPSASRVDRHMALGSDGSLSFASPNHPRNSVKGSAGAPDASDSVVMSRTVFIFQ